MPIFLSCLLDALSCLLVLLFCLLLVYIIAAVIVIGVKSLIKEVRNHDGTE